MKTNDNMSDLHSNIMKGLAEIANLSDISQDTTEDKSSHDKDEYESE